MAKNQFSEEDLNTQSLVICSEAIEATFLGENTIRIDPFSTQIGGAWQDKDKDGNPAWLEPDLLQLVYDKATGGDSGFFLDIGANTGAYCLLPAIDKRLRCWAFEPNPEARALLERNISLNGIADKVRVFPAALADTSGTAVLKIPASGSQSGLANLGSPRRFTGWHDCVVPCMRLDDVPDIPPFRIMKIDTEGAELLILKGAEKTIRRYRPDILIEYQEINTGQFGYHPLDITALLYGWGYHQVKVSKNDAFFSMDRSQKYFQGAGLEPEQHARLAMSMLREKCDALAGLLAAIEQDLPKQPLRAAHRKKRRKRVPVPWYKKTAAAVLSLWKKLFFPKIPK